MALVELLAGLLSALWPTAAASPPPVDDKTVEIVLAVAGATAAVIGSIGGAFVGSRMSEGVGKRARGEERKLSKQERLVEEERDAVRLLNDALADAERQAIAKIQSSEPVAGVKVASECFDPVYWRHITRLSEAALRTRLLSVNALLTGAQVPVAALAGKESIDFGLLEGLRRVIANARVTFEAFLQAEELPDAETPTHEGIKQLLREGEAGPAPFEPMRQWILDNPPCDEVKTYLEARS